MQQAYKLTPKCKLVDRLKLNLQQYLQRLKAWFLTHRRLAICYLILFAVIIVIACVVVIAISSKTSHQIAKTTNLASVNTNTVDSDGSVQSAQLAPSGQPTQQSTKPNDSPTNITHITEKVVALKKNDNLGKIFKRLNLSQNDAKKILALSKAKCLSTLSAGQKITIAFSPLSLSSLSKPELTKKTLKISRKSNKKSAKSFAATATTTSTSALTPTRQLEKIVYAINLTDTLIVSRNKNNTFQAKIDHIEPTKRLEYVALTINKSIYAAAKGANIPSKLVAQVVNIFKDKVNLEKTLRVGDTVSLLYEDHYLNDKKIKSGIIVAVEYTHAGKIGRAIAFTDQYGRTNYYTPEGYALNSPFLRYPLKFKYVSSPFSLSRIHPVYGVTSAHTGVDLSADRGTPIKAASDGIISFMGQSGSYGRTIELKYSAKYSTLYAHLNGFARGLQNGSRVKQGQLIGYVGNSGMATGTHLHYEFHINNAPHDPLKVKLPQGEMIAKAYRAKFFAQQKQLLARLNVYRNVPVL